jgi:hypothetical protein
MKKISVFFRWIIYIWNLLWSCKSKIVKNETYSSRFQIEYVEDVPESILDSLIFIVQDGNEPELLVFKCPCRCNANIILNLLKDASPRWSYELNNEGTIDIYPSVWRNIGCKSHFFVKDSKIKWV